MDRVTDAAFYGPFPGRLRAARIRAGMTRADLAAEAGIHRETVANWEDGLNVPRLRELLLVCAALHISPADLFPPLDEWWPMPPPVQRATGYYWHLPT